MICSECRTNAGRAVTWRCHWCRAIHCSHIPACVCFPDMHTAAPSAIVRHYLLLKQKNDRVDLAAELAINPDTLSAFLIGDDDLVPAPVLDRMIQYCGLYLTAAQPGAWIA